MAKSTKTSPARKPIKARGALPTPKSAPQRPHKRWFRHQGWQLVAIVVVIAVVGTAWAGGGAWLKNRKEKKTNTNAVAQFDRRYSVLKSPVTDVLSAVPAKTGELAAGTLPAPEFQKETEGWLEQLRKMDAELRKRTIPPGLPELDRARAVLVQGYLVHIDAVKAFSLAANTNDPALREQVIKQGNNLSAHAGSIVSTGERLLDSLKTRLGLEEPAPPGVPQGDPGTAAVEQPIQLPAEEAPPSGSGQVPGGAPGQPGAIPGMPPGLEGAPGGEVQVPPG